jgi:hypothetical protein
MNFVPLDPYRVENLQLALFKATEIIRALKGMKIFGTGFPALHR